MDIDLTFSGGGGRCFAHIGVLRALEEGGYTVRSLSACSTGAILAALVAAGHSWEEMRGAFDNQTLLNHLSFSSAGGAFDQDAIREQIAELLPDTFAELKLPLVVTATDLQNGEMLVLSEGDLLSALLGSNAFPGLFNPVKREGRWLMDGGVLNNVPNDVLPEHPERGRRPHIVVDVSSLEDEPVDLEPSDNPLRRGLEAVTQKFTLPSVLMRKAFLIAQGEIVKRRLADIPPDLLITPDFPKDYSIFDFHRLDEALDIGYNAANEALKTFKLDSNAG